MPIHRFICNKYLLKPGVSQDNRVEWGYCFDVHLNALFPLLVLLHGVVILLYHGKLQNNNLEFEMFPRFGFLCITLLSYFIFSGDRSWLDNFNGIRKYFVAHCFGLLHLHHFLGFLLSPATPKYENIFVSIDCSKFCLRDNSSPGLEYFNDAYEFLPIPCLVIYPYQGFVIMENASNLR